MSNNTPTTYGIAPRIFHWLIGIMMIGMFAVGYYMTNLLGPSDFKWTLYGLHKATGVILLALVSIRLAYRLSHKYPDLPKSVPTFQARLAKGNYFLLFLLMFSMPISGMLGSLYAGYEISVYGMFIISAFEKNAAISSLMWDIHIVGFYIFIISLAAHIGAALYHHFIVKDNLLSRMVSGK